ncbi:MAG: hypothetical protein JKY34_09280 [Kordiimonadaceae bacterium]|nr:hypothetical protein [Kordiimonadaceae bacterium]
MVKPYRIQGATQLPGGDVIKVSSSTAVADAAYRLGKKGQNIAKNLHAHEKRKVAKAGETKPKADKEKQKEQLVGDVEKDKPKQMAKVAKANQTMGTPQASRAMDLDAHAVRRKAKIDKFDAMTKFNEAQAKLKADQQELKKKLGPGAAGYTKASMLGYDKVAKELPAKVDESQRDGVTLLFAEGREPTKLNAARTEHSEQNKRQSETIVGEFEGAKITVWGNPSVLLSTLNAFGERIYGSSLPIADQENLTRRVTRGLTISMVDGLPPEEKIAMAQRDDAARAEFGVPPGALSDREWKEVARAGEAQKAEQVVSVKQAAWNDVAKGGDPDDFAPNVKGLLGPEYVSMQVMRQNLEKYGSRYAEVSEERLLVKHLALSDKEMAQTDLTPLIPRLSDVDHAALVGRKAKARKMLEARLDDPQMHQVIEKSLAKMAPPPMNWGEATNTNAIKAEENLVRDRVNDFVQVFEKQHGRKPTKSEVDSESARVMYESVSDSFGHSSSWTMRNAEYTSLSDTQKAELRIPYDRISKRDLDDITSELLRRDMGWTRELIEQLAGAYAVGDGPRVRRLMGVA